ncbi:3-hydroxyacyl-CoA dehydrogenase [Roseivivax marinus]|uniref:enoyl-CoA hydratase-related protein n=1 Tax=Roseivivax marinus TaxID=1379903 RepID=UPI0008AC29B8|nr:enoyl-CoA hydratase-related protein [Roseivivax marinus]SEL47195.1 3-hydroxyacyl-CoA dehydrogenase [Roseivivax marinus]
MAGQVHLSVTGRIALVEIDNPPVNALTPTIRASLADRLDEIETGPQSDHIDGIVLTGRGRIFSAGVEPSEHDAPVAASAPDLAALCRRIGDSPRPVIAALHGTTLGGGAEIALAAHDRIATPEARVVFPDIRLGLPPQGGATQRLPRLIGAEAALDLLLTGAPRAAVPLLATEAEGPLVAAAIAACEARVASGAPAEEALPPGLSDPQAFQEALARARAKLGAGIAGVAGRIVEAVEAAQLLPLEAGLALEREAFDEARASDRSIALRHVFTAETRARDFGEDAGPGSAPRIDTLAVLGGGLLAAHVTIAALDAGRHVRWGTRDPAALRDGVERIRAEYERRVARGALSEAAVGARLDRLEVGDRSAMVEGADVVLQAARGQADLRLPEGVVRLSAVPGWVETVGLRFSAPATTHPLVEIILGPLADPVEVATARTLVLALRKVPLRVVTEGPSATGRLTAALHRAADAMVDLGAAPHEVDAAIRAWGWTRPPFELRDATGLKTLAGAPRAEGAMNWSDRMIDAGRGGRAEGRGFYDYPDNGGAPRRSEAADALIDGLRPRAALDPEDIVWWSLVALANEGARMIEDGTLRRPLEVDVAAVLGLGMPRWRGGPLLAADRAGPLAVKRTLERMAHPDAAFWEPRPVWTEFSKNGRRFRDLNG